MRHFILLLQTVLMTALFFYPWWRLPGIPFAHVNMNPYTVVGIILSGFGGGVAIIAVFNMGSTFTIHAKPRENGVCQTGLYAYSRNPIYTGVILWSIGSVMLFPSTVMLLMTVLLFGVLMAKIRLEENFLKARYGEEYLSYCRDVGRLCPWF